MSFDLWVVFSSLVSVFDQVTHFHVFLSLFGSLVLDFSSLVSVFARLVFYFGLLHVSGSLFGSLVLYFRSSVFVFGSLVSFFDGLFLFFFVI